MKSDIKDVESIRNLVDTFYSRAGSDVLLKPIFSCLTDPNLHKETLYKYWEEALLSDVGPSQNHFPSHIELMFSSQHFIRWLTLFLETIDGLYSGPNAEKVKVIVIRKSEQFQTSLEIFRF